MVRWIGLLARLVVGGVWIWAGALKLPHLESSVTAVRAYQLLPLQTTDTIGHLLPLVEIAVGVLLVLGLLTRPTAVMSVVLLVAFIVGISSVWARGISINCGCFGDGGFDPNAAAKYPWEIARDVGLALASLLLVVRPRTSWSLDGWLFPERERQHIDVPEVLEGRR